MEQLIEKEMKHRKEEKFFNLTACRSPNPPDTLSGDHPDPEFHTRRFRPDLTACKPIPSVSTDIRTDPIFTLARPPKRIPLPMEMGRGSPYLASPFRGLYQNVGYPVFPGIFRY
ncbi:MAG: hypothetical protein HQL92_07920 [Magnetococcales bacterium]|nr:hypothetical protein [Magnetococcales bacterium]